MAPEYFKVSAAKYTKNMAKEKGKRKLFLGVDVWRSHFGSVSVTAIYDVFMQKFNIKPHNMKNYSFSHCVEQLRKLDDPEYMEGDLSLSCLKNMEVVDYILVSHQEEE